MTRFDPKFKLLLTIYFREFMELFFPEKAKDRKYMAKLKAKE